MKPEELDRDILDVIFDKFVKDQALLICAADCIHIGTDEFVDDYVTHCIQVIDDLDQTLNLWGYGMQVYIRGVSHRMKIDIALINTDRDIIGMTAATLEMFLRDKLRKMGINMLIFREACIAAHWSEVSYPKVHEALETYKFIQVD
jgi:hypothetical protein